MSLFTNEFFRVYPGREQDYQFWSTIAGLVGAFVCTLGTAIISDSYDNINYMTKVTKHSGRASVSPTQHCFIKFANIISHQGNKPKKMLILLLITGTCPLP